MDKDIMYWIWGGAATVIGTNIMNYLLTSYLVGIGYKNPMDALSKDNQEKSKIIAEQKINIDSLIQNLTETQKALADSVNSLTKRKEDHQKGISILSKYLDKDVNVREKLLNEYLKGKFSEKSFKWMMDNLPVYKPKPQIKQKIPSKK